jgi:hypothetical protein
MKINYIIILVTLFVIGGILLTVSKVSETKLVSPNFTPPMPSTSPRPKTFQFNSKTNLEAELDTVNPQVLDSDFDE